MNKLASNISFFRAHNGVHWRSDGIESLHLGERVAIGLLEELSVSYTFDFPNGFNLTKFDGTQITVRGHKRMDFLSEHENCPGTLSPGRL